MPTLAFVPRVGYPTAMSAVADLGIVLYFAVLLLGACLVPIGLPGTWVQVIAAFVLAAATRGTVLGWWWVVGFAGLAAVGEMVELAAGLRGARRFGGSRRAAWGAIVGGIVGVCIGVPVPVVGPMLGSFVGVFLGAVVGEMWHERTLVPELRVGVGAVIGRAVGVAAKAAVAVAIIGLSIAGLIVSGRG